MTGTTTDRGLTVGGHGLRRVAGALAVLAAMLAAAVQQPAVAAAAGDTVATVPEPGWTLEGVVLYSRHGMRGSTLPVHCGGPNDTDCLDAFAENPWPGLDVVAGHLTPAGYYRAVRMGTYYRRHYAAAGLLAPEGCPDPSALSFVSDGDERTIMTAGAMMDGIAPGCNLTPLAVHPRLYEGPECGFSKDEAAKASQAFVGGSWTSVAKGELAGPLQAMSKVLGPMQPAVCFAHDLAPGCRLADVMATASDPGPIAIAGASSEQFVMQYGGALPAESIGWGRLEAAAGQPLAGAVSYVNATHALRDRAGQMPAYQAGHKGSQSLSLVLRLMGEIAEGKGERFRFLASHDNYILNLGGLLGLSWHMESYQPFQVPPGGSVAFEVWRAPDRERFVRLVYHAQTLQQLRDDSVLDEGNPPAAQVMVPAACKNSTAGACRWTDFTALAQAAIVPACTSHP